MFRRKVAMTSLALSALMVLAACSSGGTNAADSDVSVVADSAGARAAIEQYYSDPEAFPITEPLKTSVVGKRIAYLDCGTPICAQGWTVTEDAAKPLGVEVERIDATMTADKVAAAFDTIIAKQFDGVINVALPNALAEAGLAKLAEAGIPVVGGGVVNGDPELFGAMLMANGHFRKMGEIMGRYVVAEFGENADVVAYVIPELELTQIIYEGFEAGLKEFCEECNVRTADIPVASIGSTAPTIVTDDLLAHPETTVAAFMTAESAIGLPAAMTTAGIENIAVVGGAPTGEALRQIRDGEMLGGVAWDFVYHRWSTLDALARLITGQALDPALVADEIPARIITQNDVTDEMIQSGSWVAFPTSEFVSLWVNAK